MQFFIEGYSKPLRLDVSVRSGGPPIRQLTKLKIPMDIKIIIFELNLRKERLLVVSVYKPPAQDTTYFLNWLSQIIDFYSITYVSEEIYNRF